MTEKAKADIVERLRDRHSYGKRYDPPADKIFTEAAETIERLRKALKLAKATMEIAEKRYPADYSQIWPYINKALNPQEKP